MSAQVYSPVKEKHIYFKGDSLLLDSFTLVMGTVSICNEKGVVISDSLYQIDYLSSLLIFKEPIEMDIIVRYQVFPYTYKQPYRHKDFANLNNIPGKAQNEFLYQLQANKQESIYQADELVRRGSISRSISIGNNQNAVMNSNLNLQLSGKLSNDLYIKAAITDNNIPIQPDGTTAQIQEFDKVNLMVYNDRFNLLAGDFELINETGSFMHMNRKVRGAMFGGTMYQNETKGSVFKTRIAGAVSKGKYNRFEITAIEGNQGPYRLKGANNESFVIVIAGSERIYMDGRLLERGLDKDYTIDYNAAELTFMPKIPVTKDKRLVAEYEYSEQSYARFTVFNGNEWIKGKNNAFLNVFHEQDSKSQSLQQDLTDDEKSVLSSAGDDPSLASVPGFYEDTVFKNDMVFYKMKDTLVGGILYDSILVYSVSSDSAKYRATFVNTGTGDYVQIQSAANGRVFKWVAPENGMSMGTHSPVRILIAPKSKTVITSGSQIQLNDKTVLYLEGGLSNNDKNTFSNKDQADDTGLSFQTFLKRRFGVMDTSRTMGELSIYARYTQARFESVERFRSAEYERDWNLASGVSANEFVGGAEFSMRANRKLNTLLGSDYMRQGTVFNGFRQKANASLTHRGFLLNTSNSYLLTDESLRNTSFFRHSSGLRQKLGPFYAGAEGMMEDNRWVNPGKDSLLIGSRKFLQLSPYVMLTDTTNYPFRVGALYREDFLPDTGRFEIQSKAREMFAGGGFRKNPSNTLNVQLTWRELKYSDTIPGQSTLTGRAEQFFRTKSQVFSFQTFYQTGSGMELKHEFAYVEVAPGQGVYQWTDYNGNNIKELDEFEVAVFSDQAKYLRVFTPGTDYMRVYTNKLSQNVQINPERIWGTRTGFLKLISRFSNNLAYAYENKTGDEQLVSRINPFGSSTQDTMLVSFTRNIRNTLSFNRTSSVFGADYQLQSLGSRLLMLNGFDTRKILLHNFKIRYNISQFYTLLASFILGKKDFSSEFFSDRNYQLETVLSNATITWQPSSSTRLSLIPGYTSKNNTIGLEKSTGYDISLEFQKSILGSGNAMAKISRTDLNFEGSPSSPVAYEMMEGLAPGINYVWTVQWTQNINKSLQMNLNYSGRKTGESKTVHAGTIEFRAFF
ncbi:MAG: hypothetical protein CVU05_13345 [Bacteroidetes bacterium HGW-Bacteroidetes-21]|nr:MAG: hypothetical protein CVU05_13345 [Bacteroidetes bacterium HGW-Bacteroidetes-21]